MRNVISKKERALLTVHGAQRIAGAGKTPSARQVRRAHDEAGCAVARNGVVVHGGADSTDGVVDKICSTLSGIGGETDAECGSFWSKIKSFVTNTASKAAPLAPLAPLAFGPAAGVALPIAQQMLSSKKSGGTPSSSDDTLQEIQGWDALGFEQISHPAKGYTYLFGDDDELEGAGGAEIAAARRRRPMSLVVGYQPEPEFRSMSGAMSTSAVPHNIYRAAIFKQAKRLGGKNPTTKHMALAQAIIDRQMRAAGLRVGIPGARPGRVTR